MNRTPPLLDIGDPAFGRALASLSERWLGQGMVVFNEGERSREVYAVLSGRVEMLHRTAEGELSQLAELGAGDVFGEFAYLTGAPRSLTAVASEDTILLELTPAWLDAAVARHPLFQERLLSLYKERVLENVFRSTLLLADLTSEERRALASQLDPLSVGTGDLLVAEGEPLRGVVLIQRGSFQSFRLSKTGRSEDSVVSAGRVFGERAFVLGEPSPVSLRAREPANVLFLSEKALKTLLRTHDPVRRAAERIVRNDPAVLRGALEEVAIEATAGVTAVRTEDLLLPVDCEAGLTRVSGAVTSVSEEAWEILCTPSRAQFMTGEPVRVEIGDNWPQETTPAELTGPMEGVVQSADGGTLTVRLDATQASRARARRLLAGVAQARIRAKLFPEADVTHAGLEAGGVHGHEPVISLGVLGARTMALTDWPAGEERSVSLTRDGTLLHRVRARCVRTHHFGRDLTWLFETEAERLGMEALVRQFTPTEARVSRTEASQRARLEQLLKEALDTAWDRASSRLTRPEKRRWFGSSARPSA